MGKPLSNTRKPAHTASKRKAAKRRRRRKIITAVASVVLAALGVLVLCAGVYIWQLLSKIEVVDPDASGTSFQDTMPTLGPNDSLASHEVVMAESDYNAANVAGISVKGDSSHITNILLIGRDASDSLADTNIILSIDTKKQTLQLISLLRDTWVIMPNYDYDGDGQDDYNKLNASLGRGFHYYLQVIEKNFRLSIDKYVSVDFDSFSYAMTKLGGVEMELSLIHI